MQKIIILFAVIFFCGETLFSQQNNIDSFIREISKAKEDSNKVNLFLMAARSVVYQDADQGIFFYLQGARLGKKINFLRGTGLGYMNLASAYSFISKVDSSLIYMDSALIYFRELNSPFYLSLFFANRADTYVQISNFKKALLDCDTATKYAGIADNKMPLAFIYNIRADIYWHLKQYKLNSEFVDKALQIHLETNNARMIAQAYSDKADSYAINKETEKAVEFYKKAIYIGDSLHDESNLSRYHSLLSEVYLDINNTNKAAAAAISALNYAKQSDNPVQEASAYTLLCKIYQRQNNMPAAIKAGRQGYNMAIQEVDLPLQQSSAGALAAVYKQAGNLDSAYHYLQISKDLNDSLITQNFNEETANLQISFDVSEKEKQIELLSKDKIIQQQELKRQKVLKSGAIVLALLSLCAVWLVFNRYQLRQRMKELELRNQIAADLHDEVGSSLSSIHLLSQMAAQPGNEAAHKEILSRMSNNAKETMDKMGDIVWMIKPNETETSSLKQRIERFAYEICNSKNIALSMQLDDLEKAKLSMEQRKNIYLIFKEALNNSVKYSNAESITILASVKNKELVLEIKDEGKGFDSNIVRKGNGLDNIKHRAAEMAGTISIDSAAGKGTTVKLNIPLQG